MVLEPGCHNINQDNGYQLAHFAFATESFATPGTYYLSGADQQPENGDFNSALTTGHWSFGPGGATDADGTSWYTYIFELLAPSQDRMRFQVGTGGTWLQPNIGWKQGDACHCNPEGWPATETGEFCDNIDKSKCDNGCCGSNGCEHLFQTMEGGTGYWNNQLPTTAVKWRCCTKGGPGFLFFSFLFFILISFPRIYLFYLYLHPSCIPRSSIFSVTLSLHYVLSLTAVRAMVCVLRMTSFLCIGRINAVTGCYKTETASPLWSFYGDELACDNTGVVALSNRFLIAPDGIAFQNEGMLGQAWIDTPVGKKSPSDDGAGRRSWTLVLNTDNFKGPVAFMLPDYWAGSVINPNTATPAFKLTR